MDFAIICAAAFSASLLTFYTGFGLGTLLLPAFAAFFPAEVAVALTAVVHFLNSLFKLVLVGWNANSRVGSGLATGLPSTVTPRSDSSRVAGVSTTLPSIAIRLSAIIRSTSRRLATPARASSLAIRSPLRSSSLVLFIPARLAVSPRSTNRALRCF